jgi:hypothetical protein
LTREPVTHGAIHSYPTDEVRSRLALDIDQHALRDFSIAVDQQTQNKDGLILVRKMNFRKVGGQDFASSSELELVGIIAPSSEEWMR